jgi:hypothetical protein
MNRFYFHLSNHTTIDDCRGDECRTVEDARALACEVAAELARARGKEIRGLFIRVTDGNGKEVFRTAVAKGWREARV